MKPTARTQPIVGETGLLVDSRGLGHEVRVLDSRVVFGREVILIEPVTGTGQAWVNLASVLFAG